jgi:uncharacterized protein (DUF2062 family)
VSRAVRVLLVAAALAMLGYRFLHVDLASFALDEPQFLNAAREQLRTGTWASANPLYGNLGVRYGPTSIWFYGLVQLALGDDPRVSIVAMGVLVTLSHLAFALALTRLFDEDAVFFAVLVAWMGSSPYQFQWSRLAWDLTSNASVFFAAALLCTFRELSAGRAVALGLAIGLGLSTHPSVLPMALAVGMALAWELRARPLALAAKGGLLAASAALVNVPYLLFLSKAPIVRRTPGHTVSLDDFRWSVLQSPRIFSTWGLEEYFEKPWPDFKEWLGATSGALGALSVASLLVAYACSVAGIALALRSGDERQGRMGRTAVVAWAGTVVLLVVLGLDRHPHYHFAAAWVPVFGVAACIGWLRRKSARRGALALAALGAIAVAQFIVIVLWIGYVHERSGIRTGAHGTPVGLQIETMKAVCSAPDASIVVRNETEMYPWPFQYLAKTEPACRHKTVVVCSAIPPRWTKPCPSPMPPGARLIRLRYAADKGGALRLD